MIENLSREEIYQIWAPAKSIWSPWVKPVLFSFMYGDAPMPQPVGPPVEPSWAPQPPRGVALILDLPREEAVTMALELARRGWRPVPLYNAVPRPTAAEVESSGYSLEPVAVVEVIPIMNALWRGTEELDRCHLADDAPPVFLLDANRRIGRLSAVIGSFDNRSVSFTTDFPSAIHLRRHGISRAMLVQRNDNQPQPDLAHTLRRWEDGGLSIESMQLETSGPPVALVLKKSSWLGALWYRLTAAAGLRRHYLGGFGGIIGAPSGG